MKSWLILEGIINRTIWSSKEKLKFIGSSEKQKILKEAKDSSFSQGKF